MSLEKYNKALDYLRDVKDQLEEIGRAYDTLHDDDNAIKFATMSVEIDVAIENIRTFVSETIAPPSNECERNVIEQ